MRLEHKFQRLVAYHAIRISYDLKGARISKVLEESDERTSN